MDSPPETRSRRVTPTVAARLLQLGSAVLVVLSFVFFVRGLNREADALFAAGGDAGLYDVGIIFVGILMLPALVVLLGSTVQVRTTAGAVLAFVSGLLDLGVVAWLASDGYRVPRRSEEGLLLPRGMVEQADQAYLLWLVLLSAAGVLAVLAGLASLRARRDDG